MAVDVVLEVAARREANIAEVARVRLLACVRPLVHQQVWNAVEEATANTLLVRTDLALSVGGIYKLRYVNIN